MCYYLYQGAQLLGTEGMATYGAVTLAICWIPGLPAAVHLLSMYRNRLRWSTTLLYALLLSKSKFEKSSVLVGSLLELVYLLELWNFHGIQSQNQP